MTSASCTNSPTPALSAPHDPYRVPAFARDLAGLPPAIVATAECDPIRDWGERYAARLRDARVQITVTRYPGVYHGFLMRSDATARGRLAIAEVCALLRAKFDHPLLFSGCPDHRTAQRITPTDATHNRTEHDCH